MAFCWDRAIQQVKVAPGGNSFSGTFTIDPCDEPMNLTVDPEGTITGTLITVDTAATSIFQQWCWAVSFSSGVRALCARCVPPRAVPL